MLKDARTLNIQGANFGDVTQLPLLCDGNDPVKSVLLYGRNGSGKSTIARAFLKIKGEDVEGVQLASVLDSQGSLVTLTQEEKDHICVFNEDFVNENVRIQEDGLGSIVMLGEQAGLAERIEVVTEELEEATRDCERKKAVVDEYNNQSSPNSPQYYINKIYTALQQDNGWAGRKRRIDGLRRNASVSDDTYKSFIRLTPVKARDELIIAFEQEWHRLEQAESGASTIAVEVPTVPQQYVQYEVNNGNALLQQVIVHPELTDREQYLLNLVQTGHGEELKTTVQEFDSPELTICPKCYQPLSEHYKQDLISSIQKVLSEEVKIHQASLQRLLVPEIDLDLNPFQGLSSYQSCIEQIEAINQLLLHNNNLLEAKINDPYTPVMDQLIDIADALSSLNVHMALLAGEREEYNRFVADTNAIKATLTRINDEIAYWDVIGLSRQHDSKAAEKEAAERDYSEAMRVENEKDNELITLNAQRDSIDIAVDVINDGLKYVFFSADRMQICADGESYKLICNGHQVKPKDISVGERNIIGLCYFFTSALKGKSVEEGYSDEYLLIIDDPVSSYDFENRIGILSYLKNELGKFLLGNVDSRAVVMTHDLLTAVDVGKLCNELMADCAQMFTAQGSFIFSPKELCNNQISRFNNKRNEYAILMESVYEYACGGATDYGPYIGNVLRQVLEAFSTFEFKKGIEAVSTDDDILSVMEHEEHRRYFKNLMYRLVLHEGSHRYDQVRNMQVDFFAYISEPEKRRTAKDILCFMALLNAPHVKSYLRAEAMEMIGIWNEEIRSADETP